MLTIRFLLFLVFFLAGASAIVLSILATPKSKDSLSELEDYYMNQVMLQQIQVQNEKIKELTDQYAAQVALIESEPNILQRFSTSTFGQQPGVQDTGFPGDNNVNLRQEAEKILQARQEPEPIDPIPAWLKRILEPKIRKALFLTGCGLILITFIFFGTSQPKFKAA